MYSEYKTKHIKLSIWREKKLTMTEGHPIVNSAIEPSTSVPSYTMSVPSFTMSYLRDASRSIKICTPIPFCPEHTDLVASILDDALRVTDEACNNTDILDKATSSSKHLPL